MKSLVEEASSIFKAIEKAWTRAEKPQSFSVKVYEEPQSGFLGFNSKPAKVGIFYDEREVQGNSNRQQPRHNKGTNRSQSGRTSTRQTDTRRTDDRKGSSDDKRNSSDTRRTHSKPEHKERSQTVRPKRSQPVRPIRTSSSERPVRKDSSERPVRNNVRSSDRNEQSDRSEQSDKQDRPPRTNNRSDDRRTNNNNERRSSERRPAHKPAAPRSEQPKTQNDSPATPVAKPVEAPKPAVRKVLRVSGRRYVGPKKEDG
jgi:hypothetical protein